MKRIFALLLTFALCLGGVSAFAYDADDDFTVKMIKVYDSFGNELSKLESIDALHIVCEMKNSGASAEVTLIAAVFDGTTGHLRMIKSAEAQEISTGEIKMLELDIAEGELSEAKAGDDISIFFWDSLSGMNQMRSCLTGEELTGWENFFTTNSCEDFNTNYPEGAQSKPKKGTWCYMQYGAGTNGGEFTSIQGLFHGKASGAQFNKGEYSANIDNTNHVWYVDKNGYIANDGQFNICQVFTLPECFAYAADGLTVSGTVGASGVGGVSTVLKVLKTCDGDGDAVTGAYDELYSNISSDAYSFSFDIEGGNSMAGDDIVFALGRSSGDQWWTPAKVEFTIQTKSTSIVREKAVSTDSVADFNLTATPGKKITPQAGMWSYLQYDPTTGTDLNSVTMMTRGGGKGSPYPGTKYLKNAKDLAETASVSADGSIVTDQQNAVGVVFTLDDEYANAESGLQLSGKIEGSENVSVKILKTGETNTGAVSGEYDVIYEGEGSGEFTAEIPAELCETGNDIVFSVVSVSEDGTPVTVQSSFVVKYIKKLN